MSGEQRYKAAFSKAGLDLSATSFVDNGNIVNGFTAPFGTNAALPPMWYTLMNADSPGLQPFGGLDADTLTYVTTHELGHTLDFNLDVPQPSASADFNRAVQNDYLYLDYTVYPTLRKPCATAAGALGYNGPFVNVTVPGTNTPICDGKASGDFGTAFENQFSNQFPNGTPNHELLWALIHEAAYNSNAGNIGNKPSFAVAAGWREWFAQMLARSAVLNLNSRTNRPEFETVVHNGVQLIGGVQQGGYMGCTAGTNASSEYDGYLHKIYLTGSGQNTVSGNPTVPPSTILSQLPARCQANLPNGWVNILN